MSTQIQAEVSGALADLKLEREPNGMPGSPSKFKVTVDTVKYLQSLLDEGKVISVGSSGDISAE